jgi:hypothetical protein
MPQTSAYGQNVKPSDGAKLYFYEAGTTTLKTVYTDAGETVASSNPVIADASGRFAPVFVSGAYKAVLKDKNDVTIWTEDNLQTATGSTRYLGEFNSSTNGGDYPSSGQTGDMYKVSAAFTLNAASGAHYLYLDDFIFANKANATGIDADWEIIKGRIWLIDEDSFASDSAVLAPSQQSVKAYTGTYVASQILDEDDFASDSDTKAPSQQSTGAYIAAQVLDEDDFASDSPTKPPSQQSAGAYIATQIGAISEASETVKGLAFYQKRIIMSNGTDANHDIDTTAGNFVFADGSGGAFATAYTKQGDVTWAPGTGNGGMAATVALANNSWYHYFSLGDSTDDSNFDFGFDDDINAANLMSDAAVIAAGLDKYKNIGSVLTDGSANILAFTQAGRRFFFHAEIRELGGTVSIVNVEQNLALSVPPDKRVLASLTGDHVLNVAGVTIYLRVYPTEAPDVAVTQYNSQVAGQNSASYFWWPLINFEVLTDTSQKVNFRSSTASANDTDIILKSYLDLYID